MRYEHSQASWEPSAVYGGAALVIAWLGSGSGATGGFWVLVALLVVGFFVALVFSRLTVEVGEEHVSAAFGLGWPKKVIDVHDIAAVRKVRNKWWYGFGIRKIPKGWMYNVWGLDAVELELESGRAFRIGTDDSKKLSGALKRSRASGSNEGQETAD